MTIGQLFQTCSEAISLPTFFPFVYHSGRRKNTMDKYVCPCGYVYDPAVGDPDNGVPAGTKFEDVPEDWVCPVCGLGKDAFTKVEE